MEDRLDLALCCFPVNERRLISTPLFEDEMVLVLPTGHPLANRPYSRGADLLGETVFFYELPNEHEELLRRQLFPRNTSAAKVRNVPLTEAIVELVRAGHGVSVLSRWSLGPHLARGGLVTQRLGRHGMRRRWSAVRPRGSALEPAIGTLIELLRSAMPLEP